MAQIVKPDRSDNRGGSRKNSGRKPLSNVNYHRRMPKSFVILMDEFLTKLKLNNK